MTALLAVVLALLSSPIGSTPSAMGAPHFVQLLSVNGLPPDSLSREAFLTGFRGAFAEDRFETERRDGEDAWSPSSPFSNRFRLLEGSPADDAWTLQLVVGAPAPLTVNRHNKGSKADVHLQVRGMTRSRGMVLTVIDQSPQSIREGTAPESRKYGFAFPLPAPPAGAEQAYTGRGYKYPWEEAGRIVGVLALDALHHGSLDLRPEERLSIAPALRADANP